MKNLCWLIACFFTISVTAQDKLVALGKAPNSYIRHKVMSGEALSTIANRYGSTSPQLAKFNGIKMSGVLKQGMLLKIPLTRNNLAQGQSATFNEPVYHVVAKGDNLYHISQAFHNVNIQSLRDWNGLKKDMVKNGQALIVGYMKGGRKADLAAKAASAKAPAVAPTPATQPETTEKTVAAIPENKPESKKETASTVVSVKSEESKPATVNTPVSKPLATEAPAKTDTYDQASANYIPKAGDEGFFALPYAHHDQALNPQFRSGDVGIFKTISGWTDRKFYVLMNDVTPGTIVRITSPANKSICAKVLDGLVETKGATGLLLRMSNAAAVALDIADGKSSTVSVTFFE